MTYQFVHIFGYPMTCKVVGQSEKGRRVEVYLPSEVLVGIAKYINEHNQHAGHAVWHYQNQDAEFPCSSCSQSITSG